MKGLSFIFIASFLFLTASCNNTNQTNELGLNKNIKQVIFFSDEKDYQHEASYYDAIIDLKKSHPDAIDNMLVISAANAKNYYDFFEVETCPAIFVVYGDQIIVKVNGAVTKDQIIKPLSAVLEKE